MIHFNPYYLGSKGLEQARIKQGGGGSFREAPIHP